MRKFSVVAAGAIFLVVCYILYSSLDSSLSRRKETFLKEQLELQQLDQRVKQLQDDIEKNDEVIRQIKERVDNLIFKKAGGAGAGAPLLQNPISSINEIRELTTTTPNKETVLQKTNLAEIDNAVCTFAQAQTSAVDVQMLDMYEMLKFDNPDGGTWKQGWNIGYEDSDIQGDENKLHVIVMPHSHTDPGWIKTFEEYYQHQTRTILTEMVRKLTEEPRMKFIYAEISFFERWWRDSDQAMRLKVKKLLDNGQFEIVTGAWVMTDEANSHYYATVDQLIEGNQWLQLHLNYTPKHHWSIDPFGLTPTMAYLMSRSNFSAMVVQRIHYSVKKYLAQHKQLEFFWRQLWSSDSRNDILCHAFPFYSYDVPHTCGPDPKTCCQFDFRRLPGGGMDCPWHVNPVAIDDANVDQRSFTLLDQYRKKAQLYKSRVLLIPLGDDFRYETRFEWDAQFSNYQRLFDHMNNQKRWNVHAQFGTLNDYFTLLKKMNKEENVFPVLSGDFFTYADRDDHYWSGYFTSRPFYKRMDRVLQYHLRAAEIGFSALVRSGKIGDFDRLFPKLVQSRRNLALFQHHDGITGTAKEYVMNDYGQKLHQSIEDCRSIIETSTRRLLSTSTNDESESLEFIERTVKFNSIPEKLVVSIAQDGSDILVYNSLGHPRTELICFQTTDPKTLSIKSRLDGEIIKTQINPVVFKDRNRMEISNTIFEVCFIGQIAAFGISTYSLVSGSTSSLESSLSKLYTNFEHQSSKMFQIESMPGETLDIETPILKAKFGGSDGYLKVVKFNDSEPVPVSLSFVQYGTTKKFDQSGAYLFLPGGAATTLPSKENKVLWVDGPLVSYVHVLTPHIRHTVTICKFDSVACQSLDISNLVDITTQENFELVMRLDSGLQNIDRSFYTDLNGLQVIRRKYFDKLPLQGNVYPMPSSAYIQDDRYRLTLLSGQPNGVGSMQKGSLEVFLDRRLMQDDNRGLFQAISDNKVTPNRFKFVLEPAKGGVKGSDSKSGYHTLLGHISSSNLLHPVFIMHNKRASTSALQSQKDLLSLDLPCDYHVVTLKTLELSQDYKNSQDSPNAYPNVKANLQKQALLLHRFGVDCGSKVKPITSCSGAKVKLTSMFGSKKLKVQEVTLNLNKLIDGKSLDEVELQPMDLNAYIISN